MPSPTATRPWRSWYGTKHWQARRKNHLRAFPLCALCLKRDVIQAAEVVDHVIPHRGDAKLFSSAKFKDCAPDAIIAIRPSLNMAAHQDELVLMVGQSKNPGGDQNKKVGDPTADRRAHRVLLNV
jgi:5-methylcytosine-specific restriction endonuclease McrA